MAVEKNEISVVIPTLNERAAIGQVIQDVQECGFHDILVVDGYSEDGTAEIALKEGARVVRQHGCGKGMALKTAVEHVKGRYMLVMDGDCTYNPGDVEKFLPHIENYDQIIGARVNGRDHIPLLNRLGNWVITKTFNFLFGTNLTDVCSGMYLVRTDFARQLNFEAGGFDAEVELVAQAAKEGKVTQVPINYNKRAGTQKLNSWKHGFQILGAVLRLARSYNPVFLFSAIAALMAIPAFAILLWVFLEWLGGLWHTGWALLGVMLILLAMQALTTSTIAVLLKRTEQRMKKS